MRYVLCTHKQALMEHKEGLPVQYLGRYNFLPLAEYQMRRLGAYIRFLVVLDTKNRRIMAKLEQEVLEHDPLAPPIVMYERRKKGQMISWEEVPYAYRKIDLGPK